jgi:hypothetical protein
MIDTSRVTEGDGLEPIRDIARVGRAWYVLLDDRVALNPPMPRQCGRIATACVWAIFGLFALWPTT